MTTTTTDDGGLKRPPLLSLARGTFEAWNEHNVPRLAAALAYATIFSIAPLFIITIAVVGAVLGFGHTAHPHTNVENELVGRIRSAAGADAATMVRGMVDASFGRPRQNLVAQVIGWVTFVLGATGLFAALQDSLNTIWDVQPVKRSLWSIVRDRAATAGMLLVIGLLLIASFLANTAISYVSGSLSHVLPFPGAGALFIVINWIVSLGTVTLLFAAIYKILPDTAIRWSDVWTGAALTALLFVIGQALIAWYLGRAGLASAYGAAGSLLALLLWIYYSSLVLLAGAEFTNVYAKQRGHHIAHQEEAAAA